MKKQLKIKDFKKQQVQLIYKKQQKKLKGGIIIDDNEI